MLITLCYNIQHIQLPESWFSEGMPHLTITGILHNKLRVARDGADDSFEVDLKEEQNILVITSPDPEQGVVLYDKLTRKVIVFEGDAFANTSCNLLQLKRLPLEQEIHAGFIKHNVVTKSDLPKKAQQALTSYELQDQSLYLANPLINKLLRALIEQHCDPKLPLGSLAMLYPDRDYNITLDGQKYKVYLSHGVFCSHQDDGPHYYVPDRKLGKGANGEVSKISLELIPTEQAYFIDIFPPKDPLAIKVVRGNEDVSDREQLESDIQYYGGQALQEAINARAYDGITPSQMPSFWTNPYDVRKRLNTGIIELFHYGRSVQDLVDNRSRIDFNVKLQVAVAAMQELAFFHAKTGLVHRDIKPENMNVFRTADGKIKVEILDPGTALPCNSERILGAGTPMFLPADEQVTTNIARDVYSMGMSMLVIFAESNIDDILTPGSFPRFMGINSVKFYDPDIPYRPALFNGQLRNIFMYMLAAEPEQRPPLSWAISELAQIYLDFTGEQMPEYDSSSLTVGCRR